MNLVLILLSFIMVDILNLFTKIVNILIFSISFHK